ncbi:MAG: patatin-like phospholipase family protein, partial [Bacteroidota bacterium]
MLSIDGGGVRGIVAARILQEIETRTGKRIHELFDLIIGNSTGGILALGLAMPDPDKQGQSKYTAHDLVKFYQDNCAKIFPQGLCYQLMAGWGLWAPKYSRASLDSILHQYMQETMLSETLVPVAVTSYSLNYAAPHLWTTRRARIDPHYDYLLHDVAGATSAAPVYFAPKIIQKSDGTVLCEADGGIWANNPEIIAITELREMYNAPVEPQDVFLLSIAAYAPKAHHRLPDLQHSGLLGWILGADLVNLMINADVEWAEVAIAAIYPASKRIKVVVPAALGS